MLVPAENVLSEVYALMPGTATHTLVHFRVYEQDIVRSGRYGESVVERIRVYDRVLPDPSARSRSGREGSTTWEVLERERGYGEWTTVGRGNISINRIPVTKLVLDAAASSVIKPPLMELANLNISHWQAYSDFRNLVHTVSMPLLWGAGWQEDDIKDDSGAVRLIYGPNRAWLARDPNAKLAFVEHNGSALDMARTTVQDIEAAMADQALRPFIEPVPRRTATEVDAMVGNQSAEILTWISATERFGDDILDQMSLWADQEVGANITIFNDFGALFRSAEELRLARDRGDISLETYWTELKRRAILAEEFNPTQEKARLASEKPPTPEAPPDDGGDEDDDTDDDGNDSTADAA